VPNVKNILLSIALASTLWGLARAQITGKNQSTIVRDGNYVELEKMPNISPDDLHAEWFHENTLVVRNDEAILDKVPIVVHWNRPKNQMSGIGTRRSNGLTFLPV
jgi:hypothetical protein